MILLKIFHSVTPSTRLPSGKVGLYHFARHICRVTCRRGFQPRHSKTATHICRVARGSVAPQRTMRSGIGGNPTTLQHPTTLIAICNVASKCKRHDETPTVHKTPSLPLRPMLRELQPPFQTRRNRTSHRSKATPAPSMETRLPAASLKLAHGVIHSAPV